MLPSHSADSSPVGVLDHVPLRPLAFPGLIGRHEVTGAPVTGALKAPSRPACRGSPTRRGHPRGGRLMARALNAEPLFPTEDIQGDILAGLPKRRERLLFFRVEDPAAFTAFLKDLQLTSLQECLAQRDLIKQRKAAGVPTLVPTPGLNVAFTHTGLQKLGVDGLAGTQALRRSGTAWRAGPRRCRTRRPTPGASCARTDARTGCSS